MEVDQVRQVLDQLVDHHFSDDVLATLQIPRKTLSLILGVLVMPQLTRQLGGSKMMKLNEIYYKTVYQFSKSNMIKLFEHHHFNILFTFYFESGTFL